MEEPCMTITIRVILINLFKRKNINKLNNFMENQTLIEKLEENLNKKRNNID